MERETPHEITLLLSQMAVGDRDAANRLMLLVVPELKKLAARYMRQERAGHTLQPTALVNEAYLKLVGMPPQAAWAGRAHFFAVASQVMRRILISHARARNAGKRGGLQFPVPLEDGIAVSYQRSEDLIALDDALTRLASMDPVRGRIVELRYFGGLAEEEIAELLGVSSRTVRRQWAGARLWLHRELARSE